MFPTAPHANTSALEPLASIQVGAAIVIQMDGAHTAATQDEGMLLQMYRHSNWRCIAILFKSIGGGGGQWVDETLQVFSFYFAWTYFFFVEVGTEKN